MTDEAEPTRIIKLGTTRFLIEPDQSGGGYVLRSSDGATALSALFTRDDALQFAQDLRLWARRQDAPQS